MCYSLNNPQSDGVCLHGCATSMLAFFLYPNPFFYLHKKVMFLGVFVGFSVCSSVFVVIPKIMNRSNISKEKLIEYWRMIGIVF